VIKCCLICNKEARLVKHHWWDNKEKTIGHIRMICHNCNSVLRTMKGDNNHMLPEWSEQVKYAKQRTGRELLLIRVKPETKILLDTLKSQNRDDPWDKILEPLTKLIRIPKPQCASYKKPPIIPIQVKYPQDDNHD
jgi:hypothetical protein